jgi:hypothetical protein
VEVLHADIDVDEAQRLMENLDSWGTDRLQITSPRLDAPIE